ncbi:hypothetical protein PGB90_003798 [Kerria lacca]
MEDLQRLTRKSLTKNRHHHSKAAVERMVFGKNNGRRGVMDIAAMQDQQIINIYKYMQKRRDKNLQINAIVNSDENLTPVNLSGNTAAEAKERMHGRANHYKIL